MLQLKATQQLLSNTRSPKVMRKVFTEFGPHQLLKNTLTCQFTFAFT